MKIDRDLLIRVVVALESGRDIDVDDLLTRELSSVPFSIATLDGCIREATGKSDLSNILQKNVSQDQPPQNQEQTCTIIDGMAAVQSLGNSAGAKTFGEWCDNFTKFVTSHFTERCTRVDLVFDQYTPNSIKGSTRIKRKGGKKKGIRKEVESRDQRIGRGDKFITTEENKRSLTNFVSTEISESYERHPRRELVVSGGFKEVRRSWSSVREDLQGLSSSQEEAERGLSSMPEMRLSVVTSKSTSYAEIQMSLFFFWLTSTIFVMKCGCFLELPERSASSQSTELRFQKKRETPCWPFYLSIEIIVWSLSGMIVTDWTKVPKFVHT